MFSQCENKNKINFAKLTFFFIFQTNSSLSTSVFIFSAISQILETKCYEFWALTCRNLKSIIYTEKTVSLNQRNISFDIRPKKFFFWIKESFVNTKKFSLIQRNRFIYIKEHLFEWKKLSSIQRKCFLGVIKQYAIRKNDLSNKEKLFQTNRQTLRNTTQTNYTSFSFRG